MIISIHIPKTGGSTFSRLLTSWFGEKILFDYNGLSYSEKKKAEIPPQCLCIHGHFFSGKYAKTFPNAKFITFLRDPAERIISHYYYWLRHPDLKNPRCLDMIRRNLSLEEFSLTEYYRNYQSKIISPKTLSEFAFVGITEKFDQSIELFRIMFSLKKIKVFRRNVNPKKKSSNYSIDENLRKSIKLSNDKDVKLYNEAKKRFYQDYNKVVKRPFNPGFFYAI